MGRLVYKVVLVIGLAILGIAGGMIGSRLASPNTAQQPAAASSPAAAPAPSASSAAATSTAAADMPAPELTGADRSRITDFAAATMNAFARPPAGTDEASWWAKFSANLTDEARRDFEGTDPQNVPFTKVTGPAKILDEDGSWHLLVEVPTDAGDFQVEVEIMGEDLASAPLRASAIVFPDED